MRALSPGWPTGRLPGLPALFLLIAPLCLPPSATGGEATVIGPVELKADALWKGECLVTGRVAVPAGVILTVEKGAVIRFRGPEAAIAVSGMLRAAGEAASPVVFEPASADPGIRWGGLAALDGGKVHLSFCRLRGAEAALMLNGGMAVLGDCSFEGNSTGVSGNSDSSLEIARCRFKGNEIGIFGQTRSVFTVTASTFGENSNCGILLQTDCGGRFAGNNFTGGIGMVANQVTGVLVTDSVFTACEVGLALMRVRENMRLTGSSFDGGVVGVHVNDFSSPRIDCSRFSSLENAIMVERFSSPAISHCLFRKNQRAVGAAQKSNLSIVENVFDENGESVFLSLSSYPVMRRNNFTGNHRDVVLMTMSSDFERRAGSAPTTRELAGKSGSRNQEAINRPREYPDGVEAANNWWGEATTREMETLGPEGNIEAIEDYFDNPLGPSSGAGVTYKRDKVRYVPWEKAPVPGAGPLPGGCGDAPADKPVAPAP